MTVHYFAQKEKKKDVVYKVRQYNIAKLVIIFDGQRRHSSLSIYPSWWRVLWPRVPLNLMVAKQHRLWGRQSLLHNWGEAALSLPALWVQEDPPSQKSFLLSRSAHTPSYQISTTSNVNDTCPIINILTMQKSIITCTWKKFVHNSP